ncbi:hypothetical protein ES703_28414 [subsurface metagenome]
MSYAKQSPEEITEARQRADQQHYDMTTPVLYECVDLDRDWLGGWWDDAIGEVTDWVDDAIDVVTDTVDTVIDGAAEWAGDAWDIITDWTDRTTDSAKETADEGIAWVNDVIDAYVWDTSEAEAIFEQWAREQLDIPDQAGKGFVDEAGQMIADDWEVELDELKRMAEAAAEAANKAASAAAAGVRTVVEKSEMALGIGFDAAMIAMAGLPALLTEWKIDLASWFDFDIDKFITMWRESESKMKEVKGD